MGRPRGASCALVLALALALAHCGGRGDAADPPEAPPSGYLFIDCGNETALNPSNPLTGEFAAQDPATGKIVPNAQVTLTPVGEVAVLNASTTLNLTKAESTLRAFSPASGAACYDVQWTPGTYSIRLGFAYYNFDGKEQYPTLEVSVRNLPVDAVDLGPWETSEPTLNTAPMGEAVGQAHYTEYTARAGDGRLHVCVNSTGPAPAILNTLELVQVNTSTDFPELVSLHLDTSGGDILSLKHRMNVGGATVEPGDGAAGQRWPGAAATSDALSLARAGSEMGHNTFANLSQPVKVPASPSNLPELMFQSAWVGNASEGRAVGNASEGQALALGFSFYPFDATSNLLLVRAFMAEINSSAQQGDRVFTASIVAGNPFDNTQNFTRLYTSEPQDVFNITGGALIGGYLPLSSCMPSTPPGENITLFLLLEAAANSKLPPLLNGLEVYELIPGDSTVCPISAVPPPAPAPSGAPPASPPSDASPPPPDQALADAPASGSSGGGGLSAGAIVGIVVGVLAAVIAIAAAAFFLSKSSKRDPMHFSRFGTNGDDGFQA